jgi:hypothetical protein
MREETRVQFRTVLILCVQPVLAPRRRLHGLRTIRSAQRPVYASVIHVSTVLEYADCGYEYFSRALYYLERVSLAKIESHEVLKACGGSRNPGEKLTMAATLFALHFTQPNHNQHQRKQIYNRKGTATVRNVDLHYFLWLLY